MAKKTTTPASTAGSPADPSRRIRGVWFPILVLVAGIVIIVLIRRSDLTEDLQYSACVITGAAMSVLWIVWFAFYCVQTRRVRWAILITPFVLVMAFLLSVRAKLDGNLEFIGFEWRWIPPPDRQLKIPDSAGRIDTWQTTPFDYPRFLGPEGNGVIANVTLEPDWDKNPPRMVWQQPIGAGWSGFAVVGNHAITQEQRGEHEMVVCRQLDNGEIMWTHSDTIRFDPSHPSGRMGGPGPRATPTIANGKVFTHGATGIVNCLDARTGRKFWSHDTLAEYGGDNVLWGKSGSPLIVDDMVVISVGAPGGKSLVAYDIETGAVAWSRGERQSSYATPVLTTLAGVRQIVCVNENWVTAHDANEGTVLWEHPWPGDSGSDATCSNPIPVPGDRILLCKGYNIRAELLRIRRTEDGQFVTEILWRKPVMRTKMTNAVLVGDYVYGLDGGILECIELETGKKMWKKGRFGHGQVLAVGDLLLVTAERTGDVALVDATPDAFRIRSQFKALDGGGKVWNYPALAGKYLLVRNAEEAACYELPLGDSP